jgi:hypothetical protein
MTMLARVIAVSLAGLLAAVNTAPAGTAAETAAQWGLLGTWRLDCSTPLSRSDPALQFVVREGNLFHERNWGDGQDSSPVLSAVPTDNGGLQVQVRFDSINQTRQWIYTRQDDGRIRSVSNKNVDTDQYSIRDGKFTDNGNVTPWQTHCR